MTSNQPPGAEPGEPPPPSLQFVGTATTVLRLGPFTVLTDPNFLHRGQRAYLGHGLNSKRLTDPAIEIADLPRLDAIALSHLHGDHWDRVARRGLDKTLPIFTTPHAAKRLRRRHGFGEALGIPTWRSEVLRTGEASLTITALPGRHAPGAAQLLLPPVMGTLYELSEPSRRTFRLYVSGDTLMGDEVRQVARHCPELDAAVAHLGGTRLPGGLMVTMDGRQGLEWLQTVRPRRAVPIHNDDYGVFRSPLSDFETRVASAGLSHLVSVVEPGRTVPLA